MPPRAAPGRARWLAAGVLASAALHGAVLAALLLWPATEPRPEDAAEGAVALVFADIVDAGGGAASADPTPPEPPSPPDPPSVPVAAAPPPPPPDAPPPPPPPAPPAAAPDAGPPTPAGILPPPAPEPPSPPAPAAAAAPPAEPAPAPLPPVDPPAARLAEPPPAPPMRVAEAPVPPQPAPAAEPTPAPVQTAALAQPPPRPARPARPPVAAGQMRLDAGIGALPDPSFGAQAMGAVVPPGTDSGQRNAPPDYPPESRRRGEEGVVRLALRVGIDGRVETAEVSATSGHPRLDQAAIEAARRWRFRPATQGGLPVAATLPTAVHFRLTEARGR